MRLTRLHIEGFGIFHDEEIQFAPGLNVVCGRNEAGKSTLLGFVQHVLFGFPDRRSSERAYPALRGGRQGGRLFLTDGGGAPFVVERFAGTRGGELNLRLADGTRGDEADLQALLGRASRDVFCKVFAFSLDELQDLKTLDAGGIRAHIYSAGTGGIPIARIEGTVTDRADALFRPSAQKPIINQLLGRIEQRARNLRELGDLPEQYAGALELRDQLEAEIEQRAASLAEGERSHRYAQSLVRAWDEWRALEDAESELAELGAVEDFPEDGLARLQRLRERRQELEESAAGLAREVATDQQLIERLEVRPDLLAQERAIDALAADRSRYEAEREELGRLEQECESGGTTLGEALRSLGTDWDEARLEGFETSIAVREEIRVFTERLAAASQEEHDRERAAAEGERRLTEARRAEAEAREAVESASPVDEGGLRERQRAARGLTGLQARHQLLLEQGASREVERAALPVWPGWALGLVALAGGVLLASRTGVWAVAGAALLCLGVLGLAGYLWLRQRSAAGGRGADTADEIAALLPQLRETADLLEMDEPASPEELGRVEARLDAEGREVQAQATRAEGLEQLEKERARRGEEQEQLARERASAAAELEAQEQAWSTWLAERGLRDALSPEGALEVLTEARAARGRLDRLRELRGRLEELRGSVSDYEERAEEVGCACGMEAGTGGSCSSRVDRLIAELEEARANRRQQESIGDRLSGHRDDLEEVERRLADLQEEEGELLAAAGAADPDEFARKGQASAQRHELARRQQGHRQQVEWLVGVGEHYERAVAVLREKSAAQLQAEAEELGDRVQLERAELDEQREELGRRKQGIEAMESQEDAAQLRLEQNADLEELAGQAREWAVWSLCRTLLEETRAFYERERRPGVIREADRFFSEMTEGRYTRIVAPLGQQQILVQDRGGGERTAELLSRGTAEQLYLALRMGLIREFGRKAEPLPVIVDDIMVNFDPSRARQAARALGALAEQHQVIVLTCHPATVELLRDGDGSVHVMELDTGDHSDG